MNDTEPRTEPEVCRDLNQSLARLRRQEEADPQLIGQLFDFHDPQAPKFANRHTMLSDLEAKREAIEKWHKAEMRALILAYALAAFGIVTVVAALVLVANITSGWW